MLKDYSGSLLILNGRNKIISNKIKPSTASKDFFSATKLMWKTIGAMLVVTLVIGISSTIWYGLQVQIALDKIGNSRAINNELLNEKKLLMAQRDLLLTHENMEKATQKLGLVSPTKNQLRYP
jgi:uncharacterized membrane protein